MDEQVMVAGAGAAPPVARSNRHRLSARALLAALDPLRIVGVVVFLVGWQLLTLRLPSIILPTPLGVVDRLFTDFLSAPSLAYYGLSEANLYGNLLYTAQNVAIAVLVGAA